MPDMNHDTSDSQSADIRDQHAAPAEPAQQPEQTPRRATRSTNKSVALLTSGLSLYLIVLWFGVTVVGDTALRSALMAALIVTIAGTGFVHSRRSVSPEE